MTPRPTAARLRSAVPDVLTRIRQKTLRLLDVRVDNLDVETALESVHRFITDGEPPRPHCVFFTNVHTIHLARRNREFLECLDSAEMVLADGSGLKIAGKAFGTPIRENLNGTDFTPRVLRYAEAAGRTVYLFGARSEVSTECRRRIAERYPRLRIVGCRSGYFTPGEEPEILAEINERRPDILLVALGSPLQEIWISRHRSELRARVCIAVGGLFDFLSGIARRAPRAVRAAGMEWIYRFFQDPRAKWRRVVVEIPSFLALVAIRRLLPGPDIRPAAREGGID